MPTAHLMLVIRPGGVDHAEMRCAVALSLLSLIACAAPAAHTQDWAPVPGKLTTRWTADVSPTNAWPEYPRPTLRRATWTNLNGLWEYAITAHDAAMPDSADGNILVPFPLESALSGVAGSLGADQRLWYRRSFALPDDPGWHGKRVLLHFGAVDWHTEVFVDGQRVGEHRGGYDPFTFDITAAIRAPGEHVLLVGVNDPSDAGAQPRGKQVREPKGIWYTPSSGIWQTVWLEPVPRASIARIETVADRETGTVHAKLELAGDAAADLTWRLSCAEADPRETERFAGDEEIILKLPHAESWSPSHPRMYELRVELFEGDAKAPLDVVETSFAFRTIAIGTDSHGVTRILLNGEPLFQFGPLDQGFWPDGLYTPPTFAAMCSDLDTLAAMGCNMLRKHVKVESELFYAECDRRGMLVWQDMPSGDCQKDPAGFERELRALIAARSAHPSIVMWVVFNEGWGQHDTARYVQLVRDLDPTRLVSNASGWTDKSCGDLIDHHQYPGPGMLPCEPLRASVLGEFGGLGLPVAGHTWVDEHNWGYVSYADAQQLTTAYLALLHGLRPLIAQGLSAAVYTQTSDVEVEVNGWLSYDRAIAKIDVARASAAARKLFEPTGVMRTVEPTALQAPQSWRWTTTQPDESWTDTDYDDSKWDKGSSGFGTAGTPGARIGTEWKSSDIWLRRSFELDPATLHEPQWCVHHDEDIEVWLNGVRVFERDRYTTNYVFEPFSDAARSALRLGTNLLAVRCHQTGGGQYIDIGISDLEPPDPAPSRDRR